jgi:hypothetical protein
MHIDTHTAFMGCGAIIVILLVVSLIVFGLINSLHLETGVTFTVTGKECVKGDKSSTYLVFTDKTTYEIDDTWIHWRWDSSDVYGKIQANKTYTADLQGYRIPFLSMYPNIINPKVVKEVEKK